MAAAPLPEGSPERVANPADWLVAVETWATQYINAYPDDRYRVGKVKYEPGGNVGYDELCKGVLTLDVQSWYAAGEPWPMPRQPSAPLVGPSDSVALTIVLKYVHCIEGMNNQGKPVDEEKGKAQQLGLLRLGFAMWTDAIRTSDTVWRKHYAAVAIGTTNRLPDAGNGTGFQFPLTLKLSATCPQ